MSDKCSIADRRIGEMAVRAGELGTRIASLEESIKTTQSYAYDAKVSAEKTSTSVDLMLETQGEMWGQIASCSNRWSNWKGIVTGVGITCAAVGTVVALLIESIVDTGAK